ncbi:hypothetical protein YY29_003233 [Salmonella enterica subsp. enterica]|nr:hypothetical protein [Salmonella enterica subsp. enterica]EDV9436116.1 hypothetical protein [Salmonella enterica subsp. enterica]EDY9238425.1 hypothetical protein [Salmonella enterica subsp. enterica]
MSPGFLHRRETIPAHAVSIDIKERGITWLLPPYSWSIRHIARKLELNPSVIAR